MARKETPKLITNLELNRALLARQHLLERTSTIRGAMDTHFALQSQEHEPHYISLWSRVDGLKRSAVDSMMENKQLVRATSLRGTIHTSLVDDYMLIRPLVAEVFWEKLRKHIFAKSVGELVAQATEILGSGRYSRAQLRDTLGSELGKNMGLVLSDFLGRAALPLLRVPLVEDGKFVGQKDGYMVADEWLGRSVASPLSLTPEKKASSMELLLRRYLAAFGPATAGDFSSWSSLPGSGKILKEMEGLTTFRSQEGRLLYDLKDAPRPGGTTDAPPRIFGQFDNLNLAYSNRERITSREFVKTYFLAMPPRNFGLFTTSGFLDGKWRLDLRAKQPKVTLERDVAFSKKQWKAVVAEFEKFGSELYGVDLEVLLKQD